MLFFKKRPEPERWNRRGPYRELPREVGRMTAVLKGPSLAALEGQLVDLSMTGVGVRIPGRRNTDLIGGDIYQVTIGSQVHVEVVTPVQLRATIEEEGAWRYGFEFIDVGDLYEQLDDFYVRYFNRRGTERMRLMAQERIALTMDWGAGQRVVQVSDICTGGVGFALSPQDLPAIEEGARVGVSFRLPGVPDELVGHATLARMTLLADRFVLGLAFDFEDPEGLARSRAQLERYVRERFQVREAWNALAG